MSDDIWLRPVDGGADRRITMPGRGAEVGGPRWRPMEDAAARRHEGRLPVLFTIVRPETDVTSELRAIGAPGFEVTHGSGCPTAAASLRSRKKAPADAVPFVPASGGAAQVLHRGEHDFCLSVAPDGLVHLVALRAIYSSTLPARLASGPIEQLTFDPAHKSQPAWSPDGQRLPSPPGVTTRRSGASCRSRCTQSGIDYAGREVRRMTGG
jgi:hypothetical protein